VGSAAGGTGGHAPDNLVEDTRFWPSHFGGPPVRWGDHSAASVAIRKRPATDLPLGQPPERPARGAPGASRAHPTGRAPGGLHGLPAPRGRADRRAQVLAPNGPEVE